MKKLLLFFIALIALLAGCNQSASASPEEISKIAYEWEKAKFDSNYDKQQELIYKAGSYEVDKGAKEINSGLKYEDIQFEVYYDKEQEYYYVFANFDNPRGDNAVEDNILFRKNAEVWKVDTSKSLDIDRDAVKKEFERQACIHCE